MPDTAITLATFQEALGEVADAIGSGDYATARRFFAKACAIEIGLPVEVGNDGSRVRMRERLESLEATIASAESSAASSDRMRTIRTRVDYPGFV